MKNSIQNDNSVNKNSIENSINIKVNRMEDDIKNIINEKDEIIKNMNDKLLKQENIIKEQSEKIEKLLQMMKNIISQNDKLNKSIYYDIEISGTDKEMKDLNGIGLDLEIFNENSFNNYFQTENNQLDPNKFIFSINLKKNDKIDIKDLVSKIVSIIIQNRESLYEKYKENGIQFKIRENNKHRIFIDFYVDKYFSYDFGEWSFDDEDKGSANDKDNGNQNDNDKYKDIFKIIHNAIKYSKILDKSDFSFYFKMYLRTNFLFKYIFEEDIEAIIKNRLDFKLIANSDINTKMFLLFILDEIEKYANKKEEVNMEKLLYSIKTLLSIPLKKIKYDFINNNKKDIHDLIIELYNHCEKNIEEGKRMYNSDNWLEKFNIDEEKNLVELLYKIIDTNELCFAFGFSNNKLGFKIKTFLPENNKINFIFLIFPINYLITIFTFLFNIFTEEKNIIFK